MSEERVVSAAHEYQVPVRGVLVPPDMEKWKKSEAFQEYSGFLNAINDAVKGKSLSSNYPASPAVYAVINILDEFDSWITTFPPVTQPQRFGNQAFRSWYGHLKKEATNVLKKHIPESLQQALPEITIYLVEGFGNSTRIDYGTGHEMSFLWFLSCLFKIGFFTIEDKCAVGCRVFDRYLRLVRKLQTTYRMEPAGSHGVWSLDDFQFVPFIWGSSQLIGHPRIEPKSFTQPELVESCFEEYLFLGCIQYINSVKTGPFFEHSNQLYNVSGVGDWSRVNQGLRRMYEAEVLEKFPVIQHALFGSLMALTPAKAQPSRIPSRRPPPRADLSQLPPPRADLSQLPPPRADPPQLPPPSSR